MRYGMSAILAVVCLAAGCAKNPPGPDAGHSADGGMVMQLKGKDSKTYDIHVPPPNGKPEDVKGVDDLFEAFTTFCLEAFPDDAAVEVKAKAAGHQALTVDEVKSILHDDPGEGWDVRIKDSVIALTIKRPPFHSCGVRAMLPVEPDIGMKTAIYVGLWGFTQSPSETLLPGPTRSFNDKGVLQTLHSFVLVGPDNRLIEQVGAYFIYFSNSQRVELRLVRMRGNNPR